MKPTDLEVTRLGPCRVPSPLRLSSHAGDEHADFVPADARVLYRVSGTRPEDFDPTLCFERAGPREKIYFDPARTRAAMVTCGGMSPGLNNVIRSIFLELYYNYGVREIVGFKYGYRGMNPRHGNHPVFMTADLVRSIHNQGGSVLGTSRGAEDPGLIVDRLRDMGINVFFTIGGDGTLRGMHAIWEEIQRRGLDIAVVGVPKTIDNDIPLIYRTFGFDTAVEIVRQAIDGAHVEAVGTPNGIGLVRVMGRDAGFIACYGALASQEVNFCLVPEVPFDLEGDGAFLECLERRILERGHAVVVVAEGAGQNLFEGQPERFDASGNRLHDDIGTLLRDAIARHFQRRGITISMKYIDPSYMIRSVKANASDAVFCNDLARNAVHAAMAGCTDTVVGLWHGVYVHVPNRLITSSPRKRVEPESYLWRSVLQATGQPMNMRAA